MKTMITTFSVLAIAVASVTGIVLAQNPNDNGSAKATNSADIQAKPEDDGEHPVFGRVLFENVTSVHFCGATFPGNSDGSFGGWVIGEDGGAQSSMTIYENYIVKDSLLSDGTVFRESRPYETLGNIEQRIPPGTLRTKNSN